MCSSSSRHVPPWRHRRLHEVFVVSTGLSVLVILYSMWRAGRWYSFVLSDSYMVASPLWNIPLH